MNKIGFDNDLYLKLQKERIEEKIKQFDNKLYLEFGGKLFDDLHASRVLPGFHPNAKIKLLETLKDNVEIVFCISAIDIERNKIRADLGLSYDQEVLRLIDNIREMNIMVSAVVITLFNGQASAITFAHKLERRGEKVYFHKLTKGYPTDVNTIVSDEGYGANPYIETTKPLVVVTAPGPCSGKLGTCLSQLYHEYKKGVAAGYAKFETFPVWNLPLKHPVNIAYEAATADLKDVNLIDPFHFSEYGMLAVNYNRDVEVFPVLKNILKKITGINIYKSPTDMGVNMIGFAIKDDKVVRDACAQEVIRRYYRARCEYKKGQGDSDTIDRIEMLMGEMELSRENRLVVPFAKNISRESGLPVVAIELHDGTKISGKTKTLISASAAMLLNALKHISNIPDNVELISANILKPILELRTKVLGTKTSVLSVEDILIALSICASVDKNALNALNSLKQLENCEAHSTYLLSAAEEDVLKKLNIRITCEPHYLTHDLFTI